MYILINITFGYKIVQDACSIIFLLLYIAFDINLRGRSVMEYQANWSERKREREREREREWKVMEISV